MVQATLRQAKKPVAPVVDVESRTEPAVEHTTTVAGQDLTESIPTTVVEAEVADPENNGPNSETALVPRQSSAVAVNRQTYASEGIEGDWGHEDLKFPQLKIVQGSGELSKQYNNGEIIYADQGLLAAPNPKTGLEKPIRFVPVSIKKQYREKLSKDAQDEGEIPRIFNSIQEVEEAGLTTRWVGKDMPSNYAEPSGGMIALIEQPEKSDHPSFVLPFSTKDGDRNYAVAVYYAAGGAFRESLKNIFNVALTSLMVPIIGEDGQPRKNAKGQIMKAPMLYKNFWTLNFVKKEVGGFSVWRPVVKLLPREETSPDIRDYCQNLSQGAGSTDTE